MDEANPLLTPDQRIQLSEVERKHKESIALNGAAYRLKIAELAQVLQNEINNGHLDQSHGNNLKNLITETNNNKPVTPFDRNLAKYVTEAYKSFVDGNESPHYKDALNNVTSKLHEVKSNFDNRKPISNYNVDAFKGSLHLAKAKRPLSKNQKVLNVAALCLFIGVALTCSIISPYIPLFGVHVLLSLITMASVGFAIYQGVKIARQQPTIFNPRPKECQVADQAVRSAQRMTAAKS